MMIEIPRSDWDQMTPEARFVLSPYETWGPRPHRRVFDLDPLEFENACFQLVQMRAKARVIG